MGTSYVPTNLSSGFQSTADLNAEFAAIAAELARMVSRFGDSPKFIDHNPDFNSNQLLNIAPGTLGTDGVNINQVTNIATGIANTILGTGAGGQGQTTGDPITFNFGLAAGSQGLNSNTEFDLFTLFGVASFLGLTVVVEGVIQYPTSSYTVTAGTLVTFSESLPDATSIMFIYGDLSPTPVFSNISATLSETAVIATAGQTVVTAPTYIIGLNQLMVHIDGIMQSITLADYTETTTTSITLDEAMAGGERLVIRHITGV